MQYPLALVAVLAVGCGPSEPALDCESPDIDRRCCGAPERTEYSCTPLPPGSVGCAGTTSVWPVESIGGPGEVAPPGCEVRAPVCHSFYPSSVASCTCNARTFSGDAGPPVYAWLCLL